MCIFTSYFAYCGECLRSILEWIWRSQLGSSVHKILQARILEWVDLPFSRDFKAIITVGEKMDSSLT